MRSEERLFYEKLREYLEDGCVELQLLLMLALRKSFPRDKDLDLKSRERLTDDDRE